MKEVVGFFGASVTAQKTGYTYLLSKKLKDDEIETHVFGYGGNHIDDAGICFLDNVIEKKNDYCFIDFFSTGYFEISQKLIEILDTIVYKFTKVNCKLIFLFFLREDHVKRIPFYNFVKEYLNKNGLFFLDINDYLEYSSDLCRDNVHTTELGSEKYANIIYEQFKINKCCINYPVNITETRFCVKIKSISINKIFKDKLILKGNCFIISFYLIVGPKSGLVEVNGKQYSVWDIYCHYERPHFNLKNINVTNELEIKVLQNDIDYSKCKREITETCAEKELNILKIFYIGESIELKL
jgi:hypothetical protein